MIALVTGPPGAGKSYYAVRKAIDALESGKYLATNVELVPGWQKKVADRHPMRWLIPGRRAELTKLWHERTYITADLGELFRLRLHGRGESRGVMVLDEAHNWMNARLWNERDRLDVVRFFSQHRKLGWDVYLITQDAQNIDRQVRSLFEYHVHLRNLRRMKVAGVPVSPINLFLAIWKWHSAGSAVVKREAYRLNGTAKLYDTMATHADLDDQAEDHIWLPVGTSDDGSPPPSPATPSRARGASCATRGGSAVPSSEPPSLAPDGRPPDASPCSAGSSADVARGDADSSPNGRAKREGEALDELAAPVPAVPSARAGTLRRMPPPPLNAETPPLAPATSPADLRDAPRHGLRTG